MRKIKGALIAFVAVATAATSHAIDADAGTVASNVLMVQVGARPAAMGNAFTAVGDDINTFYRNPAGLGFLRKSEGFASRFSGLGEIDGNTLAIAIPLGDVTSSNVRNMGVIGIGATNMSYGKTDLTDVNGVRRGDFEAKDEMVMVGWGKVFANELSIGSVVKLYRMEIFDKSDSGTAVDVGAMYRLIPGTLNVGVMGTNLGSSIAFEGKKSDAASAISAGAALMPLGNNRFMLTLDVEKPSDASSAVKGGAEWLASSVLALRAGYDGAYEAGPGLSMGAGIILADIEVGFFPVDRITLDYAYTAGDDLEYSHRIALGCRIGTQ